MPEIFTSIQALKYMVKCFLKTTCNMIFHLSMEFSTVKVSVREIVLRDL